MSRRSINLADKYAQYNARLFVTLIQSAALRSLPSPFLELCELSIHFGQGQFRFFFLLRVPLLEPFDARDVQGRQENAVQLSSALEQVTRESQVSQFTTHRHQKGGGSRDREVASELS